MQEDDTVPALTTTVTGLLLGTHTYSNVVSSTITTAANRTSPAGTYTIEVNSQNLVPEKYTVKNVNGVLTIIPYPTVITRQPVVDIVCEGSTYTFTVAGTGLELEYQWQKRAFNAWQNIEGANAASYTIEGVTTADVGVYRVILSGRTTSAISEEVELKVAIKPANILVFEWPDVPTINCNPNTNGNLVFATFQWYKNNIAIPGATKPYILTEPGAMYDCEMQTSDNRKFRLCNYITTSSGIALLIAYPNPVSPGENVTVRLVSAPQGSVVNVFDLNGGLIKRNIPMHGSEATVNISGMQPGMYVIQVVTPDGIKRTTNVVLK
jgi:hypothetical protein